MQNEFGKKLNKLTTMAEEVLRLSRNTLLVHLRFMDAALSRLKLMPSAEVSSYATDGRILAFSPMHVLSSYKAERERCVRDYMHIVLHCVFHHPFIENTIERRLWDLACDIAVENSIIDLDLRSMKCEREKQQVAEIAKLKAKINLLTAEKIYHHFLYHPFSDAEYVRLREIFITDDHFAWYLPPEDMPTNADGDSENNGEDKNNSQSSGENGQGDNKQNNGSDVDSLKRPSPDIDRDWQNVSYRTQVGMETCDKQRGNNPGGMMQNLKAVNREKYDYTTFLKRFAVLGEAMKINDDEFDYIFYTYGLKLYDKMPLVEPLEYKEVLRIKEFVIAIDTSGSVAGDLVQAFLNKTYNILKSTESFFSKINLHIIQCDAGIQEHVKITSQEEFDNYLKAMKLKGFGGTDFRPVFNYVNKLIREREFMHLKGLIYFTDGYGIFPENKPAYDAAFVFIDDEFNSPIVPPWAIKLVLQKEEI